MEKTGIDPNANIEEILLAKLHSNHETPFIEKWDFTRSLTGVNGNVITTYGTGIALSPYGWGLGWTSSSGGAIIPNDIIETNIALNIKFGLMQRKGYNNINQLLCLRKGTNNNPGFCYHDGRGKFIFVDNNSNYYNSSITDPNYFSNSIMRVEFRDDNSVHIFKDDVEVFSPNCSIDITTYDDISLGCNGSAQAFYNMIVESMEMVKL